MKNVIASLSLSLVFNLTIHAQHWLPISYQTTNCYIEVASEEVITMKNDYILLAGSGINYGIYKQFIYDQFDTCAEMVWNPEGNYGLPVCDFQGFIDEDSVMVIKGINELYGIHLNDSIGQIRSFGSNYLISYDSLFAGNDSVKFYTVLQSDSITEVGKIELSKFFGLKKFPSFQSLEFPSAGFNPRLYELIGYRLPDGTYNGSYIADKQAFKGYFAGDELLFKYVYWTSQNQTFVEVTEYHHLTVDTTIYGTSGPSQLSGVAVKYDWQGFYIGVDSNYAIPLDPNLSLAADQHQSVPFIGYFDKTNTELLMHAEYEFNDSLGTLLKISGNEASLCDTLAVIDGYGQLDIFSNIFGLIYKQYFGAAGPPETWELIVFEKPGTSFGNWPTWLGVNETKSSAIKVFPNPANDKVYLEGRESYATVILTDLAGKVIFNENLNLPNQISVGELTSGIYFLQVSVKDGLSETHKIVKE